MTRPSLCLLLAAAFSFVGSSGSQGGYSNLVCSKTKQPDSQDADGLSEDAFCDLQGDHYQAQQDCVRVAVVDYSRVDNQDCRLMVESNLDAYDEIVRLAKAEGAKLMLFPEDGILMGSVRNVFPCLEEIPNPNLIKDFNPCLQPERFGQDLTTLIRLSCLAREHEMYIVANYGGKEKKGESSASTSHKSPPKNKPVDDSYLMLNTNVVFDPAGLFIRRYRKWNPFTETEIFSQAPELEHVYFDTKYGRFGVFTCFDMMFESPAIDLVERHSIDTALFPTWWFDELPLLTAVQFQDGWSATNQVSMLSSNILRPRAGSMGSSIFSGNNSVYAAPLNYELDKQVRKTKVMVATIPTRRDGQTCREDFEPKVLELDLNVNHDKYKNKDYKLQAGDAVEILEGEKVGQKTVCAGHLCCTVSYELWPSDQDAGKLVIIARDAPRPGFMQWYEQVCALATSKEPLSLNGDRASIESLEFDRKAVASFKKLTLSATFNTKYVFPITAHSISKLVNRSQRSFGCDQNSTEEDKPTYSCRLEYLPTAQKNDKIYAFGMYARVYEKDQL